MLFCTIGLLGSIASISSLFLSRPIEITNVFLTVAQTPDEERDELFESKFNGKEGVFAGSFTAKPDGMGSGATADEDGNMVYDGLGLGFQISPGRHVVCEFDELWRETVVAIDYTESVRVTGTFADFQTDTDGTQYIRMQQCRIVDRGKPH